MKRILLALTLAFLAHAAQAQPNNFPAEPELQWHSNGIVIGKNPARIVGRRPPGCPKRYCGCGLSLKIFGRNIRRLWLAANWLAFPRTSPRPGMVAARRGHVMQLRSHVAGNRWLVFDPNSGGGKTRIHVRDISDYRIVNPRAAQLAGVRSW